MALAATIKDISVHVGDTVQINYLIKEQEKERTQPFIGMVTSIRGRGDSQTFTVRKLGSDKIAIERIFPLNSPWIKSIKITRKPKKKPRRAKLTFLKNDRVRKI
jgi:large subunit ribosomal protein L19